MAKDSGGKGAEVVSLRGRDRIDLFKQPDAWLQELGNEIQRGHIDEARKILEARQLSDENLFSSEFLERLREVLKTQGGDRLADQIERIGTILKTRESTDGTDPAA